jgi:stress-induced morphogen
MIDPHLVEQRIRQGIPDVQHLHLQDLTGTKDHYEATVVSPSFEGKTRIQQHQMIYQALGELMDGPVHALALKTFTPQAYAERQG